MRMYVFSPADASFEVYYLTNAVGTNDRLFINEIKSKVNGVMSPGLCVEAQAVGLFDDYLETTVTLLNAKAVSLGYNLRTYEDRETLNKIRTMSSATSTSTVINEVAGTVTINVPNGTAISALALNFKLDDGATAKIGATAQVSGVTTNDYAAAKTFVITPVAGSTKSYVVSVVVAEA